MGTNRSPRAQRLHHLIVHYLNVGLKPDFEMVTHYLDDQLKTGDGTDFLKEVSKNGFSDLHYCLFIPHQVKEYDQDTATKVSMKMFRHLFHFMRKNLDKPDLDALLTATNEDGYTLFASSLTYKADMAQQLVKLMEENGRQDVVRHWLRHSATSDGHVLLQTAMRQGVEGMNWLVGLYEAYDEMDTLRAQIHAPPTKSEGINNLFTALGQGREVTQAYVALCEQLGEESAIHEQLQAPKCKNGMNYIMQAIPHGKGSLDDLLALYKRYQEFDALDYQLEPHINSFNYTNLMSAMRTGQDATEALIGIYRERGNMLPLKAQLLAPPTDEGFNYLMQALIAGPKMVKLYEDLIKETGMELTLHRDLKLPPNKSGFTNLQAAARMGLKDVEMLVALHEKYHEMDALKAQLSAKPTRQGFTLMHTAVRSGYDTLNAVLGLYERLGVQEELKAQLAAPAAIDGSNILMDIIRSNDDRVRVRMAEVIRDHMPLPVLCDMLLQHDGGKWNLLHKATHQRSHENERLSWIMDMLDFAYGEDAQKYAAQMASERNIDGWKPGERSGYTIAAELRRLRNSLPGNEQNIYEGR